MDIRQMLEEAERADKQKDYAKAFSILVEGAKSGEPIMQYQLGRYYLKGLGTQENHKKALEWFAAAAENDSKVNAVKLAAYSAGVMCYNGDGCDEKKPGSALNYFHTGARRGHPWSMYKLASMYMHGEGTNDEKAHPLMALYWLSHAKSELKEAEELYNKYFNHVQNRSDILDSEEFLYAGNQLFVEERFEEAKPYYERAGKMGSPEAQFILSLMYEEGKGTEPDSVKSFEWCEKAAEQGYVNALNSLGVKYEDGEGTEKDLEKAFYWYTKAAEKGSINAQYNLSRMYEEGEGTEPDLIKSFEWCEKAAKQWDIDAMILLGIKYEDGEGTEKDLEKAFYWYTRAAEKGNARAQFLLSLLVLCQDLAQIKMR